MRTALLIPHLVAVAGFFLTHGTSAGLAFAARRERDPERLRRLLDLSSSSMPLLYGWLAVILTLGILNGFRGHFWGMAWIWLAIGLLVIMAGLMYGLGTSHYAGVRRALGMLPPDEEEPEADATDPVDIDSLLRASQPFVLAGTALVAVVLFMWWMVGKPF